MLAGSHVPAAVMDTAAKVNSALLMPAKHKRIRALLKTPGTNLTVNHNNLFLKEKAEVA